MKNYIIFVVLVVFLTGFVQSISWSGGTTTSNISSFLQLSDTPSSYSGQSGLCVKVAGTEDGVVFGSCSNITSPVSNSTYNATYDLWAYNQTQAVFDNEIWVDESGDSMTGNLSNTQWFNGKFNWTVGDDWATFDGATWLFNETMLSTIYYNATSYTLVSGSVQGSLVYTQHKDGNYDSLTFNLTEQAISPALDIRFNFTNGITNFNAGIIRYYTEKVTFTSDPIIQLWDYDSNTWESYGELTETTTFSTIEQSIFDDSEHVQNGTVQMRIFKDGNGNVNNKYLIDWLSISKGFGTPAGEEVDPIAIHKDGTTMVTANIPFDPYNVSASWFKGLFNWTTNFISNYVYGSFDGSTLTINFNETKLNETITDLAGSGSTFNSTYDLWAYNQTIPANAYTDLQLSLFVGGNSSWNESYANTLYSSITWNYNQSDGYLSEFDYNHSQYLIDTYGMFWYNMTVEGTGSTFNATYDLWAYNQTAPANAYTDSALLGLTLGNSSWNQSYADTLYSSIIWGYNQTQAVYDNPLDAWTSTYNATYDKWAYNMSDGYLSEFDYNHTIAVNNLYGSEYRSTFNATYDLWAYNMSDGTDYTNLALVNKTNTFQENITFSKSIILNSNERVCLDGAGCNSYIYHNGSDTIIAG